MGYQFNWGAVFNLDEWLNAILITCAYAFGTIAAGFVIGVVVGVRGVLRPAYLPGS